MVGRGKISFEDVRRLALALPEVAEGTSYGTPAFRVKKKLLARLKEDGDVLMVKTEFGLRDAMIAANPDVFFTTPHYDNYDNYAGILVRLAHVDETTMRDLLNDAWYLIAPKRLIAH